MRRRWAIGLTTAVATLSAASVAAGVTVDWRTGPLGADSKDASASYDEFRMSRACADRSWFWIKAAAHYPGGWTQYAEWAENLGGCACHSYSGTMTLGALIWNPHSVTQDPVPARLRAGYQEQIC